MSTHDAVSCGLRIASVWRDRNHGQYPEMLLHPKEGRPGRGFNNYAHYDVSFRPVMLELIHEYQAVKRRQTELF